MITILSIMGVLALVYYLARPENKTSNETRRFGEGLLQDWNDINLKK